MGRKYAIRDQSKFYFVTFTVVYWLDIFIRQEYRNILIESIKYCQKEKGVEVGAWCVMTSHVHLIVSVKEEQDLSSVIRDLKSHTLSSVILNSFQDLYKIMPHRKLRSRNEFGMTIEERVKSSKFISELENPCLNSWRNFLIYFL